jgi:predicted metal-dependent phosphoesterase TrpH
LSELTNEAVDKLRDEAEKLGFTIVPDSQEAIDLMQANSYFEINRHETSDMDDFYKNREPISDELTERFHALYGLHSALSSVDKLLQTDESLEARETYHKVAFDISDLIATIKQLSPVIREFNVEDCIPF